MVVVVVVRVGVRVMVLNAGRATVPDSCSCGVLGSAMLPGLPWLPVSLVVVCSCLAKACAFCCGPLGFLILSARQRHRVNCQIGLFDREDTVFLIPLVLSIPLSIGLT